MLKPDVDVRRLQDPAAARNALLEQNIDALIAPTNPSNSDVSGLCAWASKHAPNTVAIALLPADDRSRAGLAPLPESVICVPAETTSRELALRLCQALRRAVCGSLRHVNLASLLQLLEMDGKSCTLTINNGRQQGQIDIDNGVILRARCGVLEGEAAAIKIVSWSDVSVELGRLIDWNGTAIESRLGFILMESARLADEEERQAPASSAGNSSKYVVEPSSGVVPKARVTFESSYPETGELALPHGAVGVAFVNRNSGELLSYNARSDCPLEKLALLASEVLLKETETLRLVGETEEVVELVLSAAGHCDVVRPTSADEFAMIVFERAETNLVIARIELERLIAARAMMSDAVTLGMSEAPRQARG